MAVEDSPLARAVSFARRTRKRTKALLDYLRTGNVSLRWRQDLTLNMMGLGARAPRSRPHAVLEVPRDMDAWLTDLPRSARRTMTSQLQRMMADAGIAVRTRPH